jgi:hypothetical protein
MRGAGGSGMTGIEALKSLIEGKAKRMFRKYDDCDDMYICLDEDGQMELSEGYDSYIRGEWGFDMTWGSPRFIVEFFYNDLLEDDWKVVE